MSHQNVITSLLQVEKLMWNKKFVSRERCFSSCHNHRTKKTFWVPMRNCTSDLWIPCSNALPQGLYITKFSYFFSELKTYHFSYSYLFLVYKMVLLGINSNWQWIKCCFSCIFQPSRDEHIEKVLDKKCSSCLSPSYAWFTILTLSMPALHFPLLAWKIQMMPSL